MSPAAVKKESNIGEQGSRERVQDRGESTIGDESKIGKPPPQKRRVQYRREVWSKDESKMGESKMGGSKIGE